MYLALAEYIFNSQGAHICNQTKDYVIILGLADELQDRSYAKYFLYISICSIPMTHVRRESTIGMLYGSHKYYTIPDVGLLYYLNKPEPVKPTLTQT